MRSILLRFVIPGTALLSFVNIAFPAPTREARITLRDGATRTVRFEGVGCTQSICSRTAIKGKDAHALVSASLDSLAAIKDTSSGAATFVSKNGTERRLSLVKDFRVLYLETPSSGTERLDLSSVASVEFVPAHK
jgi:hypothetical protein